jgi:hypothetical protein
MEYTGETGRRKTPRPCDPSITGMIGGAQWNNQEVIDEQLKVIARNDRLILRGWMILIIELIAAVALGLVMYLLAN